jgi:hypothetical protein
MVRCRRECRVVSRRTLVATGLSARQPSHGCPTRGLALTTRGCNSR